MDLLEEGNFLLQTLNASLQVQPGQSGVVNILDAEKKRKPSDKAKGQKWKQEIEPRKHLLRHNKGKIVPRLTASLST